jgi:hypothetical protein
MFLRTTGSFEGYSVAYIAILKHFKWRRVGTITEQQDLYSMSMHEFTARAKEQVRVRERGGKGGGGERGEGGGTRKERAGGGVESVITQSV